LYSAVENAIKAVYWAMQTFGGYGYAKEYDVESGGEGKLAAIGSDNTADGSKLHCRTILGMPKSYRT